MLITYSIRLRLAIKVADKIIIAVRLVTYHLIVNKPQINLYNHLFVHLIPDKRSKPTKL